jgi:HEAT repeat protein
MWELAVVALLGGTGARLWLNLRERRERVRVWRAAAASCGLQVVEIFRFSGLRARAGPLWVGIENAEQMQPSARISIIVPRKPGFQKLRIHPQSLPLPWVQKIEIGDRAFDSTFSIEGPARLVYSLLDAETRRLLSRVSTESRLEITEGALRAVMPDEKVPDVLPLLLDIGRRCAELVVDPRRVALNAKTDPEPGVRLRNLLLLIRELPGHQATVEALRAACADPSPEIRLRAAKELGAEGRDVLVELTECELDDAVSAEAVSILERELPQERTQAILDSALRGRRLQTARVCVEVLSRSGVPAAVDMLIEVLAQEPGEVGAAAAQALGRIGSALVVLPLKEAAERHRHDRELRRAVRQAIAEIQSRLPGASPGQLSLANDEAGQLSLTEEQAGQLSLAPAQSGELSLLDPHLPDPPLPEGEEG